VRVLQAEQAALSQWLVVAPAAPPHRLLLQGPSAAAGPAAAALPRHLSL
jgi:hypothetical protein